MGSSNIVRDYLKVTTCKTCCDKKKDERNQLKTNNSALNFYKT